jgi:putative phosphoribosyl transferase
MKEEVIIEDNGIKLEGHLSDVPQARCWVIFAHGSGSSRKSPRNNWVAEELNRRGHSTLLFDLLTTGEDHSTENRFNISLLSRRLEIATQWLVRSKYYKGLPLVYFGASTGAAAAISTAARLQKQLPILTVISRGGRPDLAGEVSLKNLALPTLLLVGSLDTDVITLNREAQKQIFDSTLTLIEGAHHLFEGPGELDKVVQISSAWIDDHLHSREVHHASI